MRRLIELLTNIRLAKPETVLRVDIDGRHVSVLVKPHAKARRLTLRINRTGDGAIMTVPRRTGKSEAERFALKSKAWIATQLAKRKPAVAIASGVEIPLRGSPQRIEATGKARGLVLHDVSTGVIHVPGLPHHVKRRLTDWLKAEAKRDLATASERYASAMGVKVRTISVRDQKSRWGSCSSMGDLSYSWRLILAPDYVLDYVAAHEVAHLREMNHSPRFWRLVLTHCNRTRDAKNWLKQHGSSLHRYC
jgi:predicted metal-dependent hydrolase